MSLLLFLIVLALTGLIVGALARLALPGPDPMSILGTIALGLAGSFVGGLIVRLVFHASGAGIVVSVLCSTLILWAIRRSRGERVRPYNSRRFERTGWAGAPAHGPARRPTPAESSGPATRRMKRGRAWGSGPRWGEGCDVWCSLHPFQRRSGAEVGGLRGGAAGQPVRLCTYGEDAVPGCASI
jgi:uncharacterized membrane protein YeaQ/YmgE (transglycosylase-associated protein family)